MKRSLFLPMLALVLAACNAQPSTPIPPLISMTETLAPSAINTPANTITFTSLPPEMAAVPAPALTHIDFQDASNGWGIAVNDHGYILRSIDGGATWLNATPAGLTSIGPSASLFALNVNMVWVLVPASDFFTASLYHTSDGGLTWTSNRIPFGGAFFQFLDASNGRALADRGASAGSNAVELYQTSDSGATWTSVFHNDPTQPGSSDSLPLSGIKNGMTFLDASNGWVTGSIPMPGNIFLYETRDGGISWAQQSIPLPTGYKNYQYMLHAPIFFGQDGYLPLTIYLPDKATLAFCTTHDGGATWTGDPADTNITIPPGRYSFADAGHAWSWDGGSTLYSSVDEGQSWSGKGTSQDLTGKLKQLQFVPGNDGTFTGWALTSLDEANHSQLYRTTDKGVTWTPLIP